MPVDGIGTVEGGADTTRDADGTEEGGGEIGSVAEKIAGGGPGGDTDGAGGGGGPGGDIDGAGPANCDLIPVVCCAGTPPLLDPAAGADAALLPGGPPPPTQIPDGTKSAQPASPAVQGIPSFTLRHIAPGVRLGYTGAGLVTCRGMGGMILEGLHWLGSAGPIFALGSIGSQS